MLQRLVLIGGVLVVAGDFSPARSSAQAREGADGLAPPAAPTGAPNGVPVPPPPPAPGTLGDVPPPPGGGYGPLSPSAYAPPATTGYQVDADMATRLRVLDSDLQQLARAGNPIATGVITMATGGLSIALAFLATGDDDFLRNYLVLYGSANVLTGVTEIAVRPNASGPSIAFTHMPTGSAAEAQARLAYGEDALRRIARRSRAARLITASLDVAVGLAVIPMFLGPNDFSVGDPFDYFVLLGSGISVVTGLINLVTRSPAEKYWAAYGELDRRLRAPRPTVSLDVVPRRGGLVLTLGGTL